MKKLLSLIIAVTMMLSVVPAFATGTTAVEGEMTGSDFLALASDGVISLTGDVTLTNTATINEGSYTINLNGFTIKTPDVQSTTTNQYVNAKDVFKVTGVANLTIAGDGLVTSGKATNTNSMLNSPKTIHIGESSRKPATGSVNIIGATIKGADFVDAKSESYAIYAYGGNINISEGAVIKGGSYTKTNGSTYENGLQMSYSGKAGSGLYCYSDSVVDISDSELTGGAVTEGAEGGLGAYFGTGATGTVKNTKITGGDSNENAGDALRSWGSVCFEDCIIKGGDSKGTIKGSGIGGSAFYGVPAEGTVFERCEITAGAGTGSYPGTAFELNGPSSNGNKMTMVVKDSTISSGTSTDLYTQTDQNYGSLFWFYRTNPDAITIKNCTLNFNSSFENTRAVITGNNGVACKFKVVGNLKINAMGQPLTTTDKIASVTVEWIDEDETATEILTDGEGKFALYFPEAKIGDVEYRTLRAAVEAAKNGDEITLLKDVVINDTEKNGGVNGLEVKDSKNITLDLNGYTLTKTGSMGNWGELQTSAIIIREGSTFTLKDSSESKTGTLVGGGYEWCSGGVLKNYGTLNVESGNVKGGSGTNGMGMSGHYVVFNLGRANISGGSFWNNSNNTALIRNDVEMNITGGTFEQADFLVLRNAGFDSVMNISGDVFVKNVKDRAIQNYGIINVRSGKIDGNVQCIAYRDGNGVVHVSKTNIYDGEFCQQVYITRGGAENVEKADRDPDVSIQGGTFNCEVQSSWCAAGYMPKILADGRYTVEQSVKIVDSARIGAIKATIDNIAEFCDPSDEGLESGGIEVRELECEGEEKEKLEMLLALPGNTDKEIVAYDFSILKNDEKMTDFNNTPIKLTIELPTEPDPTSLKIYHIYYDSAAGEYKYEEVNIISIDGKSVEFEVASLSPIIYTYTSTATNITENVTVRFEETAGVNEYNIVLEGESGKVINGFLSADLTFELNTDDNLAYEIIPEANINLLAHENERYEFNLKENKRYNNTGESIVIGKVRFSGYCDSDSTNVTSFGVKDVDTNIVNTTKTQNSIVEGYSKENNKLQISKIDNMSIASPTENLTVNIDFYNKVANNAKAYQNMTLKIADGDLETPIVIELGNDMQADVSGMRYKPDAVVTTKFNAYTNNNSYRVVVGNVLSQGVRYNVEVSGAGYRTARYDVTMNTAKTLNFWNNVKDNAEVIEVGAAAATAKEATFLAGDIVKDNKINIYDLSAVVSYFGTETDVSAVSTYAKYDLNRDGVIDSKDIAYVLVSWGK